MKPNGMEPGDLELEMDKIDPAILEEKVAKLLCLQTEGQWEDNEDHQDRLLSMAKEIVALIKTSLAKEGWKSPEEVTALIIQVEEQARKFGWQQGLKSGG